MNTGCGPEVGNLQHTTKVRGAAADIGGGFAAAGDLILDVIAWCRYSHIVIGCHWMLLGSGMLWDAVQAVSSWIGGIQFGVPFYQHGENVSAGRCSFWFWRGSQPHCSALLLSSLFGTSVSPAWDASFFEMNQRQDCCKDMDWNCIEHPAVSLGLGEGGIGRLAKKHNVSHLKRKGHWLQKGAPMPFSRGLHAIFRRPYWVLMKERTRVDSRNYKHSGEWGAMCKLLVLPLAPGPRARLPFFW